MCQKVDNFENYFGWFLAISTLPLAFLPQVIKFYQRRSHVGVSLSNNLCATVVNWMIFMGYFCAQYEATFSCCDAHHTSRDCAGALSPVVQSFSCWMGTNLITLAYFAVFDREGVHRLGRDASQELLVSQKQFAATCITSILLTVVAAALALSAGSIKAESVQTYGHVINVAMCIITAGHWTLQIYETWLVRGLGSLSIMFVLVAVSGSCLTGYNFLQHDATGTAASQFICAIMVAICLLVARLRAPAKEALVQSKLEEASDP